MERNEEKGRFLQSSTKNQQLVILTRFLQVAEKMEHIDEVFLWLTDVMARHMAIDAIQIWTTQALPTGQITQTLRATAIYDNSMPQHIVINPQVAETANHILSGQRMMALQAVENIFSFYQANLLKRYGLSYCAGCFLISNIPIPPIKGQTLTETLKIPSALATLIFLKQLRPQNFLPTINLILEQALPIAESHGLLSISDTSRSLVPVTPQWQPSSPLLEELIPHRLRSSASMRSSSPLTNSAPSIAKQALAFFSLIDGSKTIAEIAASKNLSAKETFTALQILLQEKRIQLFTREGQKVENEAILKSI